jgi:hypothetical protein
MMVPMSRKTALAVGAMLSTLALGACAGNRYAVGSERLTPGDYSNGSKGIFRRIIVTQHPQLSYDIWRTDPYGVFQHLHFTLISPAQYPVESAAYIVRAPGLTCDSLTVRLYREQNKLHPDIVVLRFGDYEIPFESAGRPSTAKSYREDDRVVAKLRRDTSNLRFYDSIPLDQRGGLLEGVPNCH